MKIFKKVSLAACLFLWINVSKAQDFTLDSLSEMGYTALWALESPSELKTEKPEIIEIYIQSLHLALHTILTGDVNELLSYEDQYDLLENLINRKGDRADLIFVRSEMLLHYAFVQLKFESELRAGWAIRKSYRLAKQGQNDYPEYVPLHKTMAIHHIIMGSVPKKYDWIMSILGLEGNTDRGLVQLHDFSTTTSILSNEAKVLFALINAYLQYDQPIVTDDLNLPKSPLSSLAKVLIHLKVNQNESAISALESIITYQSKYPLLNYLMGEARIRSGEYAKARKAYFKFINTSKNLANIKDSYFKIGLTYHLEEDLDSARYFMKMAAEKGKEISEADQYASKVINSNRLPHRLIVKIRFLTDGGYYADAEKLVERFAKASFQNFDDRLEFQYRSARLRHKQTKAEDAIVYYKEVVDLSPKKGYYFAPNACLQLGYLYRSRKDYLNAGYYFKKVNEFSDYEYKNSIDRKARSALLNLPQPPSNVR